MDKHCDSNPLHPPPLATFKVLGVIGAMPTAYCRECLIARVQAALDHQEHFVAQGVPRR